MFGLQPLHLVLILIIALIIFGPARLPELGKAVGKSISEFRNANRDMLDSFNEVTNPKEVTGQKPAADGVVESAPASTTIHSE